MQNPTKLTSLLSFLSLATLAGCPGGSDHDATFADATPAQLELALSAGSGADGGGAYFIGVLLSQQTSEPGECPVVVTEGSTTTVTGGCTTDEGATVEGRIVIENVPPFFSEDPQIDPDAPQTVTYEGFHIVDDDDDIFMDGVVSLDPVAKTASVSLTLRGDGHEVRSDLVLACDDSDLCTPDGDAEIEIVGLGSAAVTGTWRRDEPAEGSVILTGKDTLTFEIGETVDACVPYTLGNGVTGEVCDVEEE